MCKLKQGTNYYNHFLFTHPARDDTIVIQQLRFTGRDRTRLLPNPFRLNTRVHMQLHGQHPYSAGDCYSL